MTGRGWILQRLSGNQYQSGLPDFVAFHPLYGIRWIETKKPGGKLRASQVDKFIVWSEYGQEIYVLENEKDYPRLFKKGNWREYR